MTPYERDTSVMGSFADFVWGAAAVILTVKMAAKHDAVSLYVALFAVIMWAFTKMLTDGLRGAAGILAWWAKKREEKNERGE